MPFPAFFLDESTAEVWLAIKKIATRYCSPLMNFPIATANMKDENDENSS